MTQTLSTVLPWAFPKGSPLSTVDTIAFDRLDFSADAVTVDLAAKTPRRVRITEAVIGAWYWVEVRALRMSRCRPVITTADRYQQALDESHTEGALWGIRHGRQMATQEKRQIGGGAA